MTVKPAISPTFKIMDGGIDDGPYMPAPATRSPRSVRSRSAMKTKEPSVLPKTALTRRRLARPVRHQLLPVLGGNGAHLSESSHNATTLKLYRNLGNGTFRDVTKKTGLDKVYMPMGANFGDIDNDGYLDIYMGTGNPS
jgi:hypothetical protein